MTFQLKKTSIGQWERDYYVKFFHYESFRRVCWRFCPLAPEFPFVNLISDLPQYPPTEV